MAMQITKIMWPKDTGLAEGTFTELEEELVMPAGGTLEVVILDEAHGMGGGRREDGPRCEVGESVLASAIHRREPSSWPPPSYSGIGTRRRCAMGRRAP